MTGIFTLAFLGNYLCCFRQHNGPGSACTSCWKRELMWNSGISLGTRSAERNSLECCMVQLCKEVWVAERDFWYESHFNKLSLSNFSLSMCLLVCNLLTVPNKSLPWRPSTAVPRFGWTPLLAACSKGNLMLSGCSTLLALGSPWGWMLFHCPLEKSQKNKTNIEPLDSKKAQDPKT